MKNVVVRVVPDIEEDVFRDICIGMDKTMEDLYNAIIQTFKFRGDQMASFYMSNDEWDKGHEIALMDMGEPNPQGLPSEMRSAYIDDIIRLKGQKIILVYDFLKMWCFYLEVFEFNDEDIDGIYKVSMSIGEVPNEDDKEMPDLMEGIDLGGDDKKKNGDSYEDYMDEFDDDDDMGQDEFDNIDDYDL